MDARSCPCLESDTTHAKVLLSLATAGSFGSPSHPESVRSSALDPISFNFQYVIIFDWFAPAIKDSKKLAMDFDRPDDDHLENLILYDQCLETDLS